MPHLLYRDSIQGRDILPSARIEGGARAIYRHHEGMEVQYLETWGEENIEPHIPLVAVRPRRIVFEENRKSRQPGPVAQRNNIRLKVQAQITVVRDPPFAHRACDVRVVKKTVRAK